MLSATLRAVRPSTLARSVVTKSAIPSRSISTTRHRRSEGPPSPSIFGPGAKAGAVPSDFEQATGLERVQMLGEIEGVTVFDKSPLDSSRIGTLADPIMILSYVWLDLPR